MKRRYFFLFLFITALLISTNLPGQIRLTLDDAVREGLLKNYRIQVARNEAVKSQKNITYGNAGFLPSVSAYGSIDKGLLDAHVEVVSGSELNLSNAEATITSAGVKAEWILFDGTGMFTEYEKLKALWRMSDLETLITMEQVTQEVILAYSNIIRQKQLLTAYRHRLDVSNFRLLQARQKFESGLGSEQEYLQAVVTRHSDSTEWVLKTNEQKRSYIQLNQLLAADILQEFLIDDSITLMPVPEFDLLIENGLKKNNFLKLQSEHWISSQLNAQLLNAERFPKIFLTGSYGYYENDTEAAFIKYNRYFGPQIGLHVGINLFDGFKLNRSLQNAKIDIQNQELQFKDAQQQITALIMDTYLDYLSRLEMISLVKENLHLTKRNLEIASEAYRSGIISSLQLREAQDDLFHSDASMADAVYQAKVKETVLMNVCGMIIR